MHARCVRMCVHGRRRVLTLKCTLSQKKKKTKNCPEQKIRNPPRQAALLRQPLSSLFACKHNLSSLSRRKTNIKCTAFGFTSATVYLHGSRSLLFLHVPDIIIAVRGMIICLLWKLADCLSPVPEELPLKGVPLEKHHKKWLQPCSNT